MATDYSDASGTNAFDLNTFRWSEKIIELAGLDGEKFPEAAGIHRHPGHRHAPGRRARPG